MVRIWIAGALTLTMLASMAALTSIAAAQKMPAAVPLNEEKPMFDEKQYKAATQRIPEAKQANDPWAGAREVTPPPTAATAPTSAKPRKRNSEQ